MVSTTLERTVLPPDESLEDLAERFGAFGQEPVTKVIGPNGEEIVLPAQVFEALRDIVQLMAQGRAVTIAPVHQRLTTQEAADLLGISRPTLVKLLESGEIAFEQPGRHRRVRLVDVLEYRDRRSAQRRDALDRMVEIADESGMYDRTAEPKRTR
jgi:excisionase family DNA binding protein